MSYRVFGSPFTLLLHQHVAYLRLKRLPFRLYCNNLFATTLCSYAYGCRAGFGTRTPARRTCVQLWQLVEAVELDEVAATTTAAQSNTSSSNNNNDCSRGGGVVCTRTAPLRLPDRRTHPTRHLAMWSTVVYACWWLVKVGTAYRFLDTSSDHRGSRSPTLQGFLRYFFLLPTFGLERVLVPYYRRVMLPFLSATGVREDTLPYMHEHFTRLCDALEAHFAYVASTTRRRGAAGHVRSSSSNNNDAEEEGADSVGYLLDTPYPTLADAALGAVFSAYFLREATPSRLLAERYPHVLRYAEHVTGWRDGVYTHDATTATAATTTPATTAAVACVDATHHDNNNNNNSNDDDDDVVPATLQDFFALQAEVMPFMASECASLRAYMTTDAARELPRVTLTDAPWRGCGAYLLPTLPTLRSLMLIDSYLHTVHVRGQDVEVAMLAAREVCDDTLGAFGRWQYEPCKSNGPDVHKDSADATATSSSSLVDVRGDTAATVAMPAADDDADRVTCDDGECALFATDTHAVYTRAGWQQQLRIRRLQLGDKTCSAAAVAGAGTTTAAGSTANVGDDSSNSNSSTDKAMTHTPHGQVRLHSKADGVMAPLQQLRALFARMHCPHYTLATVMYGRLMRIAIMPEHEAAKVRTVVKAPV